MDLTSFDRVKGTKYVVFLVSPRVLEGFQANSLVFLANFLVLGVKSICFICAESTEMVSEGI